MQQILTGVLLGKGGAHRTGVPSFLVVQNPPPLGTTSMITEALAMNVPLSILLKPGRVLLLQQLTNVWRWEMVNWLFYVHACERNMVFSVCKPDTTPQHTSIMQLSRTQSSAVLSSVA